MNKSDADMCAALGNAVDAVIDGASPEKVVAELDAEYHTESIELARRVAKWCLDRVENPRRSRRLDQKQAAAWRAVADALEGLTA